MAYGDENDFGWSNIVVKFLLFLCNAIVWLLGAALLAIGIYIHVESTFSDLGFDDFLSSPSILLMIIGSALFIVGFVGCFGALFELLILLVIYCIILSVIIVLEIAVVVYVYVEEDSAYDQLEETLREQIVDYFDDPNKQTIIDRTQRDVLQCCGVRQPRDWEENIYFACDSIAFQRCSVPYTCCDFEEGDVVNVQCGYRTLNVSNADRFEQGIYTEGCLTKAEALIEDNLYLILGVGIGLLVFQLFNVLLAAGLAVDVHREKKVSKIMKERQKALSGK